MKKTFEAFKRNPIEAVALTLCIIFLCVSGTYIVPILVNAVANSNSISMSEWIIGIAIPCISAFGAVFCIIRINKITLKGKLILKLIITAAIWFLFEVLYIYFSRQITEIICNMISGSILTAKIALGITFPLLKLPIYAVLLCMLCGISTGGKMFYKYGVKRYFIILAVLAAIHLIALVFTMSGAVMLSGIVQCILAALLAAAILVVKKTGEVCNDEKTLA